MADLTPQAFVERWERVTLSERSSYQQHFLDLCDMLDESKPAASDEMGTSYTFEKRVKKTGGGTGFADVWRRGRFAIEYKKKGGNLEAAYARLAQYREGLELPPVMIATAWMRGAATTSTQRVSQRRSSRSRHSPTSTTSAQRGWTTLIRGSTRRYSPPTAGRPISRTRRLFETSLRLTLNDPKIRKPRCGKAIRVQRKE